MATALLTPRAATREDTARPRRLRVTGVLIVAPFLVACVCVADWIFAAVRPATRDQIWLWYTATHFNGLHEVQLGFLLLSAATIAIAARGRFEFRCEVALVVEFAAYCLGTKIWPPTGDQMTWYQNAATPNVSLSEPLADVVHKIPFWLTGDLEAVRLVSPIFGVAAMIAGIALSRRLSSILGLPRWPLLAGLVASPLPFWYVTGYVENTFLAVPFIMLGLWFACGATSGSLHQRRRVVGSASMFVLAGLFHAGFMLLAVGLGAWFLLREVGSPWGRLKDVAAAVGAAVATGAVVIGGVALLPVRLAPGNSQGGYDGQLLVPFAPRADDPIFRFVFVSHAHLIEFSNIVVHAMPALVLAVPVLLILAVMRKTSASVIPADAVGRSVLLLLSCVSLAYFAFAAVWGFDLGPVGDLDLMLTMDIAFVFATVVTAARLLQRHPVVLGALLLLSGATQFAFYAMKIADVWVR